MGYEIVYAREFLKTLDGKIVPLIMHGSNNCYEYIGNREVRERYWSLYLIREKENIALTPDELMDRAMKFVPSTYGEHFVRGGKWINDDGYIRFIKNGIAKAKTFEELKNECVYLPALEGNVYGRKGNDMITVYKRNIYSSEDLEVFINDIPKVFEKNQDLSGLHANLRFYTREPIKRVPKEKTKKERLEHKFYVVAVDNSSYIQKLTRSRVHITNHVNSAKQFKSVKQAKRWIEDKCLNIRWHTHNFEVKYVA